MVLQDVNGNGKRSSAAERWLRQRGVQRTSVARCMFGSPDKRETAAIVARHEAEMELKRKEFAARYEPMAMTPGERSNFFENLIKTPPYSSPTASHGNRNADHGSAATSVKTDHRNKHLQNKQQDRHQQSSDEDRRN